MAPTYEQLVARDQREEALRLCQQARALIHPGQINDLIRRNPGLFERRWRHADELLRRLGLQLEAFAEQAP